MSTLQQYESEVPMRVLDRGDKLFWNLTLSDMGQWVVFIALAALLFMVMPDDAAGARISLSTFVVAGGWFFIHKPIGGLVGGKWLLLVARYRRERPLHQVAPPERITRMPRSRFAGTVDTRRWNDSPADGHGDADEAVLLMTVTGDDA